MDQAQVFIIDLGWFFFTAWGVALAAVGVAAFGRDLLGLAASPQDKQDRR